MGPESVAVVGLDLDDMGTLTLSLAEGQRPYLGRREMADGVAAAVGGGITLGEVLLAHTGSIGVEHVGTLAERPGATIDATAHVGGVAAAPYGDEGLAGSHIAEVAQTVVEAVYAHNMHRHLPVVVEAHALAAEGVAGTVEVEHKVVAGSAALLECHRHAFPVALADHQKPQVAPTPNSGMVRPS